MADKLMIFGKELSNGHYGLVDIGLFRFSLYGEACTDLFVATLMTRDGSYISDLSGIKTRELARDWLESEARRIMRECFEIAGPMTAGRWGEQGLPVLFDDQCSGAFRPARFRDA